MRVRWAPAARDDLRRETRYIAIDSPSAARTIARRIREATRRLAANPLMGREGRVIDTRELVVSRTPFIIAYSVTGQIVEIVGIVHQSRQWPEGFEREE